MTGMAPKFPLRHQLTPNQIVAHNVAKARALRGWTQEEAANELAPYLGARLSGPSFSALERSAGSLKRIKQFSADDLFALSRAFDLPIGYFFTPPVPADDLGLSAPDAPMNGLDPVALLDAILGRPDNLGEWEHDLLAYSASTAPEPRTKRTKPNTSPPDLAQRLNPINTMRAKALLRRTLGDLDGASDLLERLAGLLRTLDDQPSTGTTEHEPASRDEDKAPSPVRRAKR
jgi:hypothetical protein